MDDGEFELHEKSFQGSTSTSKSLLMNGILAVLDNK